MKKAKKLALADLFIDKSKYLTAIANYCMKGIEGTIEESEIR